MTPRTVPCPGCGAPVGRPADPAAAAVACPACGRTLTLRRPAAPLSVTAPTPAVVVRARPVVVPQSDAAPFDFFGTPTPPAVGPAPARPAKKPALVLLAAASVLAVGVAGVGVTAWLALRTPPAPAAVAKPAPPKPAAPPPAAAPTPDDGVTGVARLVRSAVWIEKGGDGGSGVVVRGGPAPLVVTNFHVAGKPGSTVTVIFPDYGPDGEPVPTVGHYRTLREKLVRNRQVQKAEVVAAYPGTDLAVLRLSAPLPAAARPVTLAAKSARTGEKIASIGGSGVGSDSLWRLSDGVVRSAVGVRGFRYKDGQAVECRTVEHSMPINPGDSGSGVVNDAGELVGVNCGFDAAARAVSAAIDVSEVRDLLAEVPEAGGK